MRTIINGVVYSAYGLRTIDSDDKRYPKSRQDTLCAGVASTLTRTAYDRSTG